MEIKFLGTGSAFDYELGTSAATIKTPDGLFLIDCGSSVFQRLVELDLVGQIDGVLLTHMHGDHVGCLFQLLAYHNKEHQKPLTIIYPTEAFREVIQSLLNLQFSKPQAYEFISIENFNSISAIDTYGLHVPDMPNIAYYFTEGEEIIYYSGDIGTVEPIQEFLKNHEDKKITIFHEAFHADVPGHVYYKTLNETLSGQEVYLYHCDEKTMPADNTMPLVATVPKFNW